MRKGLIFFILSTVLILGSCNKDRGESEASFSIIPKPAELSILPGSFELSQDARIIINSDTAEMHLVADFLVSMLKNSSGFLLPVEIGNNSNKGDIFMMLNDELDLSEEGYILIVKPGRVILRARTTHGMFYAIQSLRQLLPASIESGELLNVPLIIPSCTIKDEPRFDYRGMHLDVGRHLFPIDYIKRFIDMMALHKMNNFHWHLTEDQGWRIEIDKYPLLTEVGAYRKETIIGHAGRPPFEYDGKEYGGFYTKEEIQEIIKYASDRFITIIPEIELPGHAQAALAAYPGLSCTGGPFEVATKWGVSKEVYCAGKEETFEFLTDVLSEVIELFPGEYIHIGGDECPKDRWSECPDCKKRMEVEGLEDEHELQSYFIRRIEKYLTDNKRKLIGWDEILEGGLAPEATVMSWRGTKGGIEAAKQGHDVIMTPNNYVYLDYYQCEPEGEPLAIGGYLPLEKVYSYEPVPEELTAEEGKYILGVQGNVWSEYLSTPDHMEYMAYPRFFAIAEIGWTSNMLKDFEDFLLRFNNQSERYDIIGINYFKGEYYDTRMKAIENF